MANNTIGMRVIRSGITPQDLLKNIEFKDRSVKTGLIQLGHATAERMKTTIDANRKRNKEYRPGKRSIKDFIKSEKIGGGKGLPLTVGVGNVSSLNLGAPYWYIVNYGGQIKTVKGSHFTPGSFSAGTFDYQPGSNRGFILPSGLGTNDGQAVFVRSMSYIEKTAAWANSVWRITFDKETKKTKVIDSGTVVL